MRKYLLLILLALIIPSSYGYLCYQETANSATSCGGRNTGNYRNISGENWAGYFQNYDEDWTSGGSVIYGPWENVSSTFYINYSIMTTVSNIIWEVKDQEGVYNLSIPQLCNNGILQLAVNSSRRQATPQHHVNWQCYNGTDWVSLRYSGGLTAADIYEEAVIWNITTINLTFSRPTNGSIICDTGGFAFLNNYTIYRDISDFSTGYCNVKFNEESSYAQIFTFYNNNNENIEEELEVLDGTLQLIKIKVISSGSSIEGAYIKAYQKESGGNMLIFSTYTDGNGEAYIYGNADNLFLFSSTKDGYSDEETEIFIPTGYADTVIINMNESGTIIGNMMWYSNCMSKVKKNTSCSFYLNSYEDVYNITINYNFNGTNSSKECLNTSYCATPSKGVDSSFRYLIGKLYLNGTFYNQTIQISYVSIDSREVNITFPVDALKQSGNEKSLYTFYFLIMLVGIFISYSLDKKKEGAGPIAMMVWFGLMAYIGFYIFWFVVAMGVLLKVGQFWREQIDN